MSKKAIIEPSSELPTLEGLKTALALMEIPFVENQSIPDNHWLRGTVCDVGVSGTAIGYPRGFGYVVQDGKVVRVMDDMDVHYLKSILDDFEQKIIQYTAYASVLEQLHQAGAAPADIVIAEDGTIDLYIDLT
jgi:hypothetical protein